MTKELKSTVPAGMCWVWGRRPGTPIPYQGVVSRDLYMWLFTYETTREAIRHRLPEPLELADQPPIIGAWAATAPHWRAYDGRRHSYTEFGWFLPCQYKGVKGANVAYVYMDSPSGDLSDGGYLGALDGREVKGFSKAVGRVRMIGDGYDCRATCDVRGTRLADISFTFSDEMPGQPPTFFNEYFENFLFVKEIPNCTFTGYDVRKVIGMKNVTKPENVQSLRMGEASMTYGHLDSDPVDVLEIVKPVEALELRVDIVDPESFSTESWEIDDLLK